MPQVFPTFSRSQLPHAVGAAYSLKMDGKDACAVTYFGDGGSSEVNMYSIILREISLFNTDLKDNGESMFQ
jgi:hypothetical protein